MVELGEWCYLQPNSFSHHNFSPPVAMLDQLVSFNWDQVSSHLITAAMDWSMILDWGYQTFDLDRIFWSARSRIEYLSNNTSWIKFRTKHLPPAYSTQMADQYGLKPEDYVLDLKKLSNARYSQGMLFLILSFSKQQLTSCQVIVATLMVYDFIDHIPQQVSLCNCERWFHISLSPSFSTSTGMLPIQWLTIATDMWKLRRKWSELPVIYFSVLTSNWIGMM